MSKLNGSNNQLSSARRKLCNPYAYLDDSGTFDQPASTLDRPWLAKTLALSKAIQGTRVTKQKIKDLATTLQRELWAEQKLTDLGEMPDPFAVLNPDAAIRMLGIDLIYVEGMEEVNIWGPTIGTAGLIDRKKNQIAISQVPPVIPRRFTTAHELGHWLLHPTTLMHRDQSLDDKFASNIPKTPEEREANDFASRFLMPKKLVIIEFRSRFGDQIPFELTAETAFNLNAKGYRRVLANSTAKESRSKLLASATYYAGQHFESLHTRFFVSAKAMTYRLIELGIVK